MSATERGDGAQANWGVDAVAAADAADAAAAADDYDGNDAGMGERNGVRVMVKRRTCNHQLDHDASL
ncbi:unnamed protein product [Hydatigera taeniaeformis]|uniref:Uncharacterized protein n=1 Tax=Hydatigena taeniaeformis TaxID=6205 RepID=A0A0R3XBR6_HYDTA|nr:unnamed protein product [Hydatigera taeniaeformis]